jgi:hypothetical protein
MVMYLRNACFAILALLAPAPAVFAHHSFGAFDMEKVATVVGTVREYQWTNPHVWIQLNVANAKGTVEEWGFETASPNVLGRRGWSRTTMQPGDKISITYHPSRDRGHGGAVMSVTLPSGKVLVVLFA